MNEELQQQIVQLVQAAMQGDEQANQQIQQIMQAAQQGDPQATQIAQMIQAVVQQMQGQQAQRAQKGAKLNYIKQLRGQCPEGYELEYFKKGGQLCKKCVQKQKMQQGGDIPQDPIDAFKCGRKMKKKEEGGSIDVAKCGKKIKKDACGSKVKLDKCGSKMKKHELGDKITENDTIKVNNKTYSLNPKVKQYPQLTPEQYRKLPRGKQADVDMKEEMSGRTTPSGAGSVTPNKNNPKKHLFGGSLNSIPFTRMVQ